jgi:hypothetical protein
MTPTELEEYKALRATIRERGTARVWIFAVGLMGWAALGLTALVLTPIPIATCLPLLVLVSTFEAVFGLHIGVERIGRYLQACRDDQWEATAMQFGAGTKGGAVDPLFMVVFALATLVNFLPALLAQATPIEASTLGAAHLLFLVRLAVARRAATQQRATELKQFEALGRRS